LAAAVKTFAATPFESPVGLAPQNKIDEIVFARLQELHIAPARLCSDPVFVRRVYLDVTGTLPTAAEAEQFILDRNPDKRRVLIDRLLARDEYADYLAMKWGDVLRIKAEFPINLWPNAAQSYHRWVHDAVRDNMPCDKFARELLTASGSDFENPPVNFYRAMQNRTPPGIAQTVALTFLGERAELWPLQIHRRVEGGNYFLQSRLDERRRAERLAAQGGFSRRRKSDALAGPGSARGVCQLAGERSAVRAEPRQPRVVVADRPRHRAGAG
jgi:hypothetical protein